MHDVAMTQEVEERLPGLQAQMFQHYIAQAPACCGAGHHVNLPFCGILQELAALQDCLLLQSDADQHKIAVWAATHLEEAGKAAEHALKICAEHQRKRQEEEEAM